MLIGIAGYLGSGKTLLMTILSYIFHKKTGLNVKANYGLEFGELFNPMELMTFPDINNIILCVDEAYTLFDSRVNSNATRNTSYYFFQSRKRNVYVFYTAQLLGSVDLRINGICDAIIHCRKKEIDGHIRFKYQWYIEEREVGKPLILTEDKAKKFFPLYDTTEIVYPIEMLGEYNVDFDDILELFTITTTKTSFQGLLRSEYPTITIEKAKAIYDMIKQEKYDIAKRLLGIRDKKDDK